MNNPREQLSAMRQRRTAERAERHASPRPSELDTQPLSRVRPDGTAEEDAGSRSRRPLAVGLAVGAVAGAVLAFGVPALASGLGSSSDGGSTPVAVTSSTGARAGSRATPAPSVGKGSTTGEDGGPAAASGSTPDPSGGPAITGSAPGAPAPAPAVAKPPTPKVGEKDAPKPPAPSASASAS